MTEEERNADSMKQRVHPDLSEEMENHLKELRFRRHPRVSQMMDADIKMRGIMGDLWQILRIAHLRIYEDGYSVEEAKIFIAEQLVGDAGYNSLDDTPGLLREYTVVGTERKVETCDEE